LRIVEILKIACKNCKFRIRKKAILSAFDELQMTDIDLWRDEAREALARNGVEAMASARAMQDAVGDDIAAMLSLDADDDELSSICAELFDALRRAVDPSEADNNADSGSDSDCDDDDKSTQRDRAEGTTMSRVLAVFAKDLKKRRDAPTPDLDADAIACQHAFYGEPCGGLACQVCGFETKNKVG
jgi:hypothetical protein